MGLITLLLLLLFTVLALSKTLEKKPAFVDKIVAFATENRALVTMGALIYALVAFCLTPVMIYNGIDMLVRMLANALIVIMVLPATIDRLLAKLGAGANGAIAKEVRGGIDWIGKQEKILGYAGAVLTLLLFAFVFR